MEFHQPHPFVNSSGECFIPYLQQWTVEHSLVGLISELIREFSLNPPIIMKTSAIQIPHFPQSFQPQPPSTPVSFQTPSSSSYPPPATSPSFHQPTYVNQRFQPFTPSSPPPQRQVPVINLTGNASASPDLIKQVTRKIHDNLMTLNDLAKLEQTHRHLESDFEKLNQGIEAMNDSIVKIIDFFFCPGINVWIFRKSWINIWSFWI